MKWAEGMFKTLCETAVKLSKNPLGVICFTLLGLYTVAGMVIVCTQVKDNWVIACILAYPVLGFVGLCWLIGKHYNKFFAPGDFSTEDNFLKFAGVVFAESATRETKPEEMKPEASIGGDSKTERLSPREELEPMGFGAKPFRTHYGGEAPEEPSGQKGMEGMILNTLWVHQVNHNPTFESQWMFKLFPNNPVFLPFYQAVLRLVPRGLVSLNHDGMIHLTLNGWVYCKAHHKEFPPDDFFSQEPVNTDNLAIALAPPEPKP